MEFKDLEEQRHQMNIARESIDYILSVINKNRLKKVLEIGCFNGYSALMFSTIAQEVKSIEIDKKAIQIAKNNFERYEVKNIQILEGDAKEVLSKLNEQFDVILIDAMKKEYKEYLILCLKLINKYGFIFADNTISHKEQMKDFFDYLESSNVQWKELNIGKKGNSISGLVEIKC